MIRLKNFMKIFSIIFKFMLFTFYSTIYLYHAGELIYAEHDDRYLKECLLNLKSKDSELVNGKTIDEMLLELDLKGIV